MLHKIRTFLFSLLAVSMAQTASATLIDVGSQEATFGGLTRGFYFVAPTDFTIIGLGVATDASTDNFDVSLIRLNVTPPAFAANTTDFSTLFLSRDNAGAGLVATDIDIFSGDIIGVLGSRGPNSTNSYGAAAYMSSILGFDVTLNRLLMQGDLRTTDPSAIGVSTEDFFIGRVLVDVEASSPVPTPATLALFGLGLVGLGWSRRRPRS